MRVLFLAAALAAGVSTGALAQDARAPALAPATSAPADVSSPEAVIAALYDVISGDAGAPRNWDRFRGLFHPTGRLIPTGTNRAGVGVLRSVTVDEYIANSGPMMMAEGFYETEISRRIERIGRIAHVWSTYESRHAPTDPAPFTRGVNSIQLFYDGQRWWVLSVYWQPETGAAPIPAEYLPPNG